MASGSGTFLSPCALNCLPLAHLRQASRGDQLTLSWAKPISFTSSGISVSSQPDAWGREEGGRSALTLTRKPSSDGSSFL